MIKHCLAYICQKQSIVSEFKVSKIYLVQFLAKLLLLNSCLFWPIGYVFDLMNHWLDKNWFLNGNWFNCCTSRYSSTGPWEYGVSNLVPLLCNSFIQTKEKTSCIRHYSCNIDICSITQVCQWIWLDLLHLFELIVCLVNKKC